MIPFWKKTGKHSKPQSAQKRRQKAKPAVPRTAQQSIPMQRMFEDGTCRVKPNYYTRTIQYQDINYQLKHIRVTADAVKIEPIITAPIMALPLLLVLLLWLLFSNRKRKSTRGEKHETH